ncbi:MAG TPA: thiamine phosphate synthase [Acidimicrobiales bacterium]
MTRLLVVTDRAQAEAAGHTLRSVVTAALEAGAREVLFREKDLPVQARRRMAEHLAAQAAAAGAALYVASDVSLAWYVDAQGVHLASDDPWPDDHPGLPWGRSCHTVEDLIEAQRRGAAWATLSPVFTSFSKPGYGPPIGLGGLAAGVHTALGLPVLALGGIGPGRARGCVEAGAAGVAVMGAVMGADHPAAVVRAMLGELAPLRSPP